MRLRRHQSLDTFLAYRRESGGRLIALSAHARQAYHQFHFHPDDWLLFGRESDGLPAHLVAEAEARLTIPMPLSRPAGTGGVRSLNLSVAVGVVLFEALRQGTAEGMASQNLAEGG